MITTKHTEERIVALMAKGAKLIYHCYQVGSIYDGWVGVSHVTLEHNGYSLMLTTKYRKDEYYFVPCDEDGAHWLRHGEYSQLEDAADIADVVSKRPDIQSFYAGYRGNWDRRWREGYEHRNQPQPRWVTEQWTFDEDGQRI